MEDETPKKTDGYQIGQNIDLLSVEEIEEVISSLTAEITRLEAAKSAKETHLQAAESLFGASKE